MAGFNCVVNSVLFLLGFLLWQGVVEVRGRSLSECDRLPIHTTAPQTPGDAGYQIIVKGVPRPGKFRPGENYTLVIKNLDEEKIFNTGILGVMLVAVPQGAKDESVTIGNFSLPTDHVKAAENCDHTVVVHYFLFTKKKIKVDWQAPAYGCVEFRATIISEDPTLWYKDDGGLTYKMCAEDLAEVQALGDASVVDTIPECCACGEARYSMEFKGLWSRQTHPKGFPTGRNALLLHWSNIVGATHTSDYFIWNYGEYSERGVREVCEYGYSSKLETDMKKNSDKIYTVIKTSPMWRDVTGTRESRFSVNQKAHLLSILTMVGPSPDWCIGIPSLSMCNANCTWMDRMVVDLYPWDAGTDDGIEYVNSAKIPTDPPQRIQRITHKNPKHPDSPFYGPRPIKPLAQVVLTKVKEFCGDEDASHNSEDAVPSTEDLIDMMKKKMMMSKKLEMMKCATTDWTDWTECSNNCGAGMRQRSREMVNKNITPSMCNLELMEKEPCQGSCLSKPVNRKTGRDKLSNNFEVRHTHQLNLSDPCAITPWSDWSPCTAKLCGRGVRERWRMYLSKSALTRNCGYNIMEKDVCYGIIPDCRKAYMMKNFTAICSLPKFIGPCRGSFQRWYYDTRMHKCLPFQYSGCRGNDNRFKAPEECHDQCAVHMNDYQTYASNNRAELTEVSDMELKKMMMMKKQNMGRDTQEPEKVNVTMRKKRKQMEREKMRERRRQMKEKRRMMRKGGKGSRGKDKKSKDKIDCMVTQWTEWEQCSKTCGTQYITRSRMIKLAAQNGGKKCPKKLERRRKCRIPKCPRDCKVSEWSKWGSCAASCGESVRERSRKVMVKPKFEGMDCPSLREREACNNRPCTNSKDMKDFLDAMQASPPH